MISLEDEDFTFNLSVYPLLSRRTKKMSPRRVKKYMKANGPKSIYNGCHLKSIDQMTSSEPDITVMEIMIDFDFTVSEKNEYSGNK